MRRLSYQNIKSSNQNIFVVVSEYQINLSQSNLCDDNVTNIFDTVIDI